MLAGAGLLTAGGLAVFKTHGGSSDKELISVGRSYVRRAIPDALKTRFSGENETHIERLPDHKFQISGWVDIVFENGTIERQKFSCVIYKTENDAWAGEKVAVLSLQP